MNPVLWSIISAIAGTVGVQQIVTYLLNRGKVKVDEALAIRVELREEINRKNTVIAGHEVRIVRMEQDFEARELEYVKKEQEFKEASLAFRVYKLDVYRVLLENNVDKTVLDKLKILDF